MKTNICIYLVEKLVLGHEMSTRFLWGKKHEYKSSTSIAACVKMHSVWSTVWTKSTSIWSLPWRLSSHYVLQNQVDTFVVSHGRRRRKLGKSLEKQIQAFPETNLPGTWFIPSPQIQLCGSDHEIHVSWFFCCEYNLNTAGWIEEGVIPLLNNVAPNRENILEMERT